MKQQIGIIKKMAEQNIWKKQAKMNQSRGENKLDSPRTKPDTSSPINQYLKNTNNLAPSPAFNKNMPNSGSGNTPPWVKNANNANEASTSQPSLPNNGNNQGSNVNNNSNQETKQPPWAKNNAVAGNLAPWAKNNAGGNQKDIAPKPVETASQPPWVKNNKPNEVNSPVAGNQPPWVKNNPPSPRSPVVNQQSWVKNNDNVAPWAKNNQNSGANQANLAPKPVNTGANQPPWVKQADNKSQSGQSGKNEMTQSTTRPVNVSVNKPPWVKDAQDKGNDPLSTPPWMKNSNASDRSDSKGIQNNSWKRQQSDEIEKHKRELEEKIKREEEEERQKKRIARQLKQKEEDDQIMARELLLMASEDEHSMEREKFDKQQQQRKQKERIAQEERARQEEERVKKQQEDKQQKERLQAEEKLRLESEQNDKKQREKQQATEKSKSKKNLSRNRSRRSVMETSKISHISSIKGFENIHGPSLHDPSIPEKNYHKYLRLINEETIEIDYKKKIDIQKAVYQLQLESRKDCETQLMNLFASKKITNRKRKFIFSNSMQIQYALCEGRNEESGLIFNNEEIEELKTRFLQYELLTKCVLNLIKKKINIHLRVPLLNYAEYKGVSFLVEHVCQELVDIIEIEIGLFQEIANQVLIFEKELELSYEGRDDLKAITKQQLMVKKISIYGEDYYILYIKTGSKPLKHRKSQEKEGNMLGQLLPKFSHLNDLNVLEYIIGKNSILPYYQNSFDVTKSTFNQLEKVVPPALRSIIHSFCLARAIKIVYCSCQGQVNEESFYQLVLDGNKEIWDMIVAAGSPDRELPKPMSLAALQKLSAVRFNFNSKMFSKKRKEIVKRVKPAVFIQKHDYELFEFIKNLEKYIEEDKEELVEQSLTLSRQLWEDLKQGQQTSEFSFIKLKSQVSYLLYKQKELEAIELIEEAKQQVGEESLQTVPIFLLALKIYVAKDMEMPLLQTFSDMLPVLEFYFGEESMLHASVYTIVANFYAKRTEENETERAQKVVTFYEHALRIALKFYGEKALEVADIYLNRASAFVSLTDYEKFEKDIQQAIKIYKTHSKSAPKIAQCNHLIGRVKCLEGEIAIGIELMEMSSRQFMKMYHYMDSLYILFEMLPFLEYKESELENKIEKIVEICFTYKSVWAFRKIVTLVLDRQLNCYTSLTIQNLQELFHPLDPDDRTHEEVLIDLEEELKGFTSFIEIVRWALSIIAGKLAARREATSDYEKAHRIVREIFMFYGKSQPMESKDLNSQLI